MDSIVVGVDATEDSVAALAEAARLTQETGVGLMVVFVRHESHVAASQSAIGADAAMRASLDTVELSAYVRSVAVLSDSTVHWRFDVRRGDPATELIAAAREHHARAIVVGGRSHGIVGGIVAGSVAQKLVRQSPVSVLVVRLGSDRVAPAAKLE